MGGGSSTPATGCEANGNKLCETLAHATICVPKGTDFQCGCQNGYRPEGTGVNSVCLDINECAEGRVDCSSQMENSTCKNTEGSYECTCGQYRTAVDSVCQDIDECKENNGGCGEKSDCVNQDGKPPLCRCWDGYGGNNFEVGVNCTDINECSQDTSPCPANANCVNTAGSYHCVCKTGYTMSEDETMCNEVDACSDGTDDCDEYLATCTSSEGSYTCQCKQHLIGSGKKNDCSPLEGYEHIPCELTGLKCGSYKECEKTADAYSCKEKTYLEQVSTLISEGISSDTPTSVTLGVAGGGIAVAGLLGCFAYYICRPKRKSSGIRGDETDRDYGEGYGSTFYYG